ncbi:MAG: ubiquinone/menaquinone biosynthesis C-methylase UbiE [Oceanicoccus sp.]|jgi:ubiquinone/menaquinone biosynthesis C-methylase UbiE
MRLKTNDKIVPISEQQTDSGTLLLVCKACADQLRLDILQVLSNDSFGVLELCSIFDTKQSGMSHHLKILANADLVITRREGNSIFYRRSYQQESHSPDAALNTLQFALHGAIDQRPLSIEIQERVNLVQEERAARSRAFFSENAKKFRQQHEQIADYALYGPNARELLDKYLKRGLSAGVALEVGPGEGVFLSELASRFSQVYALDNSEQMLVTAAKYARAQGLGNITFVNGDTKHEQLQSLQVDCVVINMVLHHIPSPADMFLDISKVLKPGGSLIVTDLCSHDQAWARESCGDVWLGFEPEDLTQWAVNAGLKTAENIFLAQRNGFRVQIRQFIKL